MSEKPLFTAKVAASSRRLIHAKKNANQGVWFGLGMMGLIGWSIVLPTLIGAALGMWLDDTHANQHHWTLALIVAGLCIGCINAWNWVSKEDKAMHEENEDEDE